MIIKSIFEPDTQTETFMRINKLTPTSQALWGKMDVAQMLKHCTQQIKFATRELQPTRLWIGWLFGHFFKHLLTNETPFEKNSPTLPQLKIVEKVDFDIAQLEILETLERLIQNGEKSTEGILHPFFGKLTAEQWAKGTWKHLDHHLKQFGV